MFSVVIPLYNKAHIITDTLRSVLAQTFENYEIIVVDDGSTDDGVKVINESFCDERIKIVKQNNCGVSVARNNGIEHSKFGYIALLDGDDAWHPHFLEKVYEAIQKFPQAGLLGTTSYHVDYKTGEKTDATLGRYRDKILKIDYFENPRCMPHTSAMVLRKDIALDLDERGPFPPGQKLCEDWTCFYRMAFKSPFVYIGIPLGIRNNNIEGQVTSLVGVKMKELAGHVIQFYNTVYEAYSDSLQSGFSQTFITFLKYDLRSRMLQAIANRDYSRVEYFSSMLSQENLDVLTRFERFIFRRKKLRYISLFFIYSTKILWRMKGYPRIGSKK